MEAADLDVVRAIDAAAAPATWGARAIHEEFGAGLAFVGDVGGSIRGFLFARDMVDTWWLMLIAVDPAARRAGVGRALLEQLVRHAGSMPVGLEVRASNAAAHALYTRCGFTQAGVRRRYYPPADGQGAREDALIWTTRPTKT